MEGGEHKPGVWLAATGEGCALVRGQARSHRYSARVRPCPITVGAGLPANGPIIHFTFQIPVTPCPATATRSTFCAN
ncbi:MAG: hypothetical protein EOP15_14780 [Pseudomonas sp.]|nr:MAG: hypothetical protein EOP15_14780 [Pseudomonas sp.]